MLRLPAMLFLFTLVGCQAPSHTSPESSPKGELSFLAAYKGKKSDDVGLLSNHVVTRRIANLWKDQTPFIQSLQVLNAVVDVNNQVVTAQFNMGDTVQFGFAASLQHDAVATYLHRNAQCEVRCEQLQFNPFKGICP